MINTRVKVVDVIKDKIYDCIVVDIDGLTTQIVFSKEDNVEQYIGKEITLSKIEGCDYAINAPAKKEEIKPSEAVEIIGDVKFESNKKTK